MSAAQSLFTPGAGDRWVPLTVRLADIPKGQKLATYLVYLAIHEFLYDVKGVVLGERYTDRVLGQSIWLQGFSRRFIQKGLKSLQDLGLISRQRAHGRRILTVIGKLRGHMPVPERDGPKRQTTGQTRSSTSGKALPQSILDAVAAKAAAAEAESKAVIAEKKARRAAAAAQATKPAPEPDQRE